MRYLAALIASISFASLQAGAGFAAEPVRFRVSVESLTGPTTLVVSQRRAIAAPISPGSYLVSARSGVLFEDGRVASAGLERLAEDGDPSALIAQLNASGNAASAFLHDQDFVVSADRGDRLHFAVMFAQSNDLFYAPAPTGIDLFSVDGRPVSGDVTGQLMLWDAGTEKNEQPGVGPNQAPRQPKPDSGAAENGAVRRVADGFAYPPVRDVIRVWITPESPASVSNGPMAPPPRELRPSPRRRLDSARSPPCGPRCPPGSARSCCRPASSWQAAQVR